MVKNNVMNAIKDPVANMKVNIPIYNLLNMAVKAWGDENIIVKYWEKFNNSNLTDAKSYDLNIVSDPIAKTKAKVTVKAKTPTIPKAKVTIKAKDSAKKRELQAAKPVTPVVSADLDSLAKITMEQANQLKLTVAPINGQVVPFSSRIIGTLSVFISCLFLALF